MKKTILVLIVVLFITNLKAQDEKNYKNKIYIVPTYLINSGLKLDFEHQIGSSNANWLVLGPQFYYKDIADREFRDFRGINEGNLLGGGIDISYKHFLSVNGLTGNSYYQIGLSSQHFKIEDTGSVLEQSIVLNKLGSQFIIGYQLKDSERLCFDFYTGLGFRYTFDKSENEMSNDFSQFSWDFGYTGPIFLFGIKLGIEW